MSWNQEDDQFLIECVRDGELDHGEIAEFFDRKTRIDVMERVSHLKREGKLSGDEAQAETAQG